MDEGLPISYEVLEKGIPVLSSEGEQVGTVHHVVAATDADIFHGIVMNASGGGRRFIPAEEIESLHERGVDLRIDAGAAAALPQPHGAAGEFREDPGEVQGWQHWIRKLTLRGDWRRRS